MTKTLPILILVSTGCNDKVADIKSWTLTIAPDVVEAEVVWTIAWRSCRGAGLNNILADKECEGAESEEWSMNVSRSSGLPSSDLLPVAEI